MVGLFLMVNQGEVLLIVTLILPPNESGSVKVVKCLCAALVIIVAGGTMPTPVPTWRVGREQPADGVERTPRGKRGGILAAQEARI